MASALSSMRLCQMGIAYLPFSVSLLVRSLLRPVTENPQQFAHRSAPVTIPLRVVMPRRSVGKCSMCDKVIPARLKTVAARTIPIRSIEDEIIARGIIASPYTDFRDRY